MADLEGYPATCLVNLLFFFPFFFFKKHLYGVDFI
jgi:hypothetical protein